MTLPKDIEELKQFFKVFSKTITEPCYRKPKIGYYALGLAGAILLGVVGDHFISSRYLNNAINQKNAELVRKDQEYNGILNKRDEELAGISHVCEEQKTSLALLAGKNKSLEEELQGLKSTPLGEQVLKQKDELQVASQNYSLLKKRFENLEKILQQYQEDHPIAKEEYETLQTQVSALRNTVGVLERKVNATQEEKDELFRKYTDLREYLEKLPQFRGKLEQIEKDLQALRQPKSKISNEHYDKGNVKRQLKLYKEAIEEYDEAIAEEPQNADAYNNRGIAKYELSLLEYDYDNAKEQRRTALKDFDTASELKRDDADFHNNLAILKFKESLIEDSKKSFAMAVELKSDSAIIYYNLGIAKSREGWFKEVMDEVTSYFTKAIKLKPDFSDAYLNRALIEIIRADYEQAGADFRKAIELNQSNALAYYNRGVMYCNQREQYGTDMPRRRDLVEKAIEDFSKAIELEPDHACLYRARKEARESIRLNYEANKDSQKERELEQRLIGRTHHNSSSCRGQIFTQFILIEK